jgi:hypothetical protein
VTSSSLNAQAGDAGGRAKVAELSQDAVYGDTDCRRQLADHPNR